MYRQSRPALTRHARSSCGHAIVSRLAAFKYKTLLYPRHIHLVPHEEYTVCSTKLRVARPSLITLSCGLRIKDNTASMPHQAPTVYPPIVDSSDLRNDTSSCTPFGDGNSRGTKRSALKSGTDVNTLASIKNHPVLPSFGRIVAVLIGTAAGSEHALCNTESAILERYIFSKSCSLPFVSHHKREGTIDRRQQYY